MIERAPVHADADGFVVFDRHFNHGAEIVVIFAAHAHVAGIDPVLSQGPCAFRVFRKQKMAVIVEVANDGDVNILLRQFLKNFRDSLGRGIVIHSHADHFRSRASQLGHLLNGGLHVCRVSICH